MHTLFHIRNVIIPRDQYRPEGFSPSVDIGRGMIIVQTQTYIDYMSDQYRFRDANTPVMEKVMY
jgi:hypothetical protein